MASRLVIVSSKRSQVDRHVALPSGPRGIRRLRATPVSGGRRNDSPAGAACVAGFAVRGGFILHAPLTLPSPQLGVERELFRCLPVSDPPTKRQHGIDATGSIPCCDPWQAVQRSTGRAPMGCTGRLLPKPSAPEMAAIWAGDALIGWRITSQRTPSLQGGVVSEPL